jgi:hypothetical protein
MHRPWRVYMITSRHPDFYFINARGPTKVPEDLAELLVISVVRNGELIKSFMDH